MGAGSLPSSETGTGRGFSPGDPSPPMAPSLKAAPGAPSPYMPPRPHPQESLFAQMWGGR